MKHRYFEKRVAALRLVAAVGFFLITSNHSLFAQAARVEASCSKYTPEAPSTASLPGEPARDAAASVSTSGNSSAIAATYENSTTQNTEAPDLWTLVRRRRWISENPDSRTHSFGVHAGFSLPQNDLRNTTGSSPQMAVGTDAERLFQGVHQFRSVAEYWFFREGHQYSQTDGRAQELDTKVRTLVLGGQYLYRIGGSNKRLSVGGGLYLMRWSVASEDTLALGAETAQASGTSHWYRLGESGNAVYRLSHRLDIDGRWTHSHYGYENIPINTALLGAAFRF